MNEHQHTPEHLPRHQNRRTLALLTALALAACNNEGEVVAAPTHAPQPPTGGNFDIHYDRYEGPFDLNCKTGPFEQQALFEGTVPKAYVFTLEDGSGKTVQAMRVKVMGDGTDIQAAAWRGDARDQSLPEPAAGKPTVIPFKPGAQVRLERVKDNPYAVKIGAVCD